MAIKKKTKEELRDQTKAFLSHVGNITEEKKDEILAILGDDSVNIDDNTELKNKLSGIISEEQFSELRGEYVEYLRISSQMKKIILDNKLFPVGYEFLVDELVKFGLDTGSSVESLKSELSDENDVVRFRSIIGENIELLSSLGFTNDSLKNLFYFICIPTNDYIDNFKLFMSVGIVDSGDLYRLKDIIENRDIEKIKLFVGAGFSTVDDFLEIDEIMHSCSLEKMRDNLKIFLDVGINNPKDLILLENFIGYGNTEILKIFADYGINTASDFKKLSRWIMSTTQNIAEILLGLTMLGEFSVDDFLKMQDKFISGIYTRVLDHLPRISEETGGKLNDKAYDLQGFFKEIVSEENIVSKNVAELNLLCLYRKGFSFDDIKRFGSYLEYAKVNNLKFIVEKYPGISIDELISISDILSSAKIKNLETFFQHFHDLSIEELFGFCDFFSRGKVENFDLLFGTYGDMSLDDLLLLQGIICNAVTDNLELFINHYPNATIKELTSSNSESISLGQVLSYAVYSSLELIFSKYPDISIDELISLYDVLSFHNGENLRAVFNYFGTIYFNDLSKYDKLLFCNFDLPWGIQFMDKNTAGYLPFIEEIIDLDMNNNVNPNINYNVKYRLISDIAKLPLGKIENYLKNFKEFCVNQGYSYDVFLKCFDGEVINRDVLKFFLKGFDIPGQNDRNDVNIFNNAIINLYPNLNIKFNEIETNKILDFVDNIGGVNKGYTILVLTMEKMVRDGVDNMDFTRVLCEKLDNYKKVFDLYPEDKIPDGLKISIGIEFEINRSYAEWFKNNFGTNYPEFADQIVRNAKVGIEREGTYEFATKPSTNPMVALLEMYLLHELDLFDLNGLRKFSGKEVKNEDGKEYEVRKIYEGRNGTGYHLNIGSDSEIGIDENIQFIQNLCTILPRSGICNGGSVSKINRYSNINSKSSNFSVFPKSLSKSKKYIELRTYSVDDVELFEKNVLFNTYAVMGSQAQKKVSTVTSKTVMYLRNNDKINNSDDLMRYLVDNNLFLDDQDYKSKKIAVEFMFMQISVLRAIRDYNEYFFDNELFGINEISNNLNDSWKNYFMDLLCLDNGESIGYNDSGHSFRFVKFKCRKLYLAFLDGSFNFNEYLEKNEPFSLDETKKILDKYGEIFDENKISLVTLRLNKRLLREKLIIGCEDTQNLEKSIAEKKMNIDRIRSHIRGMDQTLKVDKQYLQDYFNTNMSLIHDNPYHGVTTDFMNKIINLNNFFLKKDDTNANGVLQKTIFEGEDEPDISKSSIFETGGYMRKGYNYYQGGTKDMLLHKTQTIALNYMENVKNILNSDSVGGDNGYKLAA